MILIISDPSIGGGSSTSLHMNLTNKTAKLNKVLTVDDYNMWRSTHSPLISINPRIAQLLCFSPLFALFQTK
jgi:hypothetical protein